jgi:hypothetical protein
MRVHRRQSGPQPSGASGSSSSNTDWRTVAAGTTIGSGTVADGASNAIDLTLPDGTSAVVYANGLSAMLGGVWWDLGSDFYGGFSLILEWVTQQNDTEIAIGIARLASAPTALSDFETASMFCQVRTLSTGNTGTLLRKNAETLQTSTGGDKASAAGVSYQINATDDNLIRHHVAIDAATDYSTANSSTVAASSGNYYAFLLFGAGATVSGDTTISLKLRIMP